jgi:hypothetical protein
VAWETNEVTCLGCRALAAGEEDLSDKRRRYVTVRLDPIPLAEVERRLDAEAASDAERATASTVTR